MNMLYPPFTTEDILNQLDACARNFTFPMLDNGYRYLADTRLTAYRDQTRWALIVEVLGSNFRAGGHNGINNCLYCFGNCITRPPGTADGDFLRVTDDGPEGPTFDEEYDWFVREDARTIRIRGLIVPINISPEALAHKRIEMEEPPNVTAAELLRSLLPEHRDLLLATEEELKQRLQLDIPRILRLDEWHHPDLCNNEVPGESATFRMIAEVLVSGRQDAYKPNQEANTHWRNWPEGGSL